MVSAVFPNVHLISGAVRMSFPAWLIHSLTSPFNVIFAFFEDKFVNSTSTFNSFLSSQDCTNTSVIRISGTANKYTSVLEPVG